MPLDMISSFIKYFYDYDGFELWINVFFPYPSMIQEARADLCIQVSSFYTFNSLLGFDKFHWHPSNDGGLLSSKGPSFFQQFQN